MDDANLLKNIERVAAPPDFERRVMGELVRRRAALPKVRRSLIFRYSLAGTAAALLICFLVLNLAVPQKNEIAAPAGIKVEDRAKSNDFLPITEAMDYGTEIRRSAYEPRTVYILEQISTASDSKIKY
jgi:hypothetical protein